DLPIVLCLLRETPERPVRRVVLQHIENEAFLDSLTHRVEMERTVPTIRVWPTEALQRLALRCGREREEAQVRLGPARGHHPQDLVLATRFLRAFARFRVYSLLERRRLEHLLDLLRRSAGL